MTTPAELPHGQLHHPDQSLRPGAQRIIDLRISPINVSVHATDPKLRCTLLGNKRADKSLELMRRFGQAGIVMNGQIVLCPGFNDGAQLQRTMEDMAAWGFASCSIVPVGLTKYRQGLAKLRPVDRGGGRRRHRPGGGLRRKVPGTVRLPDVLLLR